MAKKIRFEEEIEWVDPRELKPSKMNSFMPEQGKGEYEALKRDIKERGIITPLQVRMDDVIVAGMTRHQIALELDLPSVPVQRIKGDMTKAEEKEFVIKDNFHRRQLTVQQKLELYRELYPNFDERVEEAKKLGIAKAKGEKYEPKLEPLPSSIIARDTGQSRVAVMRQLQRQGKENLRQQKEFYASEQQYEEKILSAYEQRKIREHDAMEKLHKYIAVIQKSLELTSNRFKQKVANELRKIADEIEQN